MAIGFAKAIGTSSGSGRTPSRRFREGRFEMEDWIEVLGTLLMGAIDDAEAARQLGVAVDEIQRLKQVVAGDAAMLVPIAVDLATHRVELLDLAGIAYREPFFHETIEVRRRERPAGLNVEVDLNNLVSAARRYRTPPDGFIFHVGRCGSTLLANMLAASGEHLLIKEPELVSELIAHWLHAEDDQARQQREALVDATVRCLLGTAGSARYRVLKFAAWNIRMAGVLARLFPSTPAVFLYRSPLETVASMLFRPPAWFDLIGGPRPIQARFFPTVREAPEDAPLSAVMLFAHAWRSAAEAALALPPGRAILLDYGEMLVGAADAIKRVLTHLRQPFEPQTIAAIVAARTTYSKDGAAFDPAGAHRRPPLSATDEAQVRTIVGDVWTRLEARRLE